MKNTTICIQYEERFGETTGSTAINLPAYIEETPITKMRSFFKLAAQYAHRFDNAGEILKLEAYLTTAIKEAEQAAEAAKTMDAKPAVKKAEIERAERWLTKVQKARDALADTLSKTKPKR